MRSVDEGIIKLYNMLGISQEEYAEYPQTYDIITPYEKCSADVSIPISVGNSTITGS